MAVTAAVCLMVGGSCAGGPDQTDAAAEAARLRLPQQVVGLQVAPEEIGGGLDRVERSYVDTVALFSLREGDLLRASLQVNRFNSAARPDDDGFLRSIANSIGGTTPLRLKVEGRDVYATRASDQTLFVWFGGDGMFILAVQREFEFPRTLLRRLLEQGTVL